MDGGSEEEAITLPAGAAPCTTIVVKVSDTVMSPNLFPVGGRRRRLPIHHPPSTHPQGNYRQLSLAFYGEIEVDESSAAPFPDASRLCPAFRPRALPSESVHACLGVVVAYKAAAGSTPPHPPPPPAIHHDSTTPSPGATPPPLALLGPLAAARQPPNAEDDEDETRDPRSEHYRVPAAAVERVAAAVRACVGAGGEEGGDGAGARREAAVEGLRAAVEGLWEVGDTEGPRVKLADAVARWEEEPAPAPEQGEGEGEGEGEGSTVLADLVHCALSLLGHARPDVPSDLALSADDECQLALASGALGLRLASALCASPLLAHPFLRAGGGYALQAVLSHNSPVTVTPPGQWLLPCLEALWHAVQDPATLGDIGEEGRVANVRPYVVREGEEGGPSFHQSLLLLLAR